HQVLHQALFVRLPRVAEAGSEDVVGPEGEKGRGLLTPGDPNEALHGGTGVIQDHFGRHSSEVLEGPSQAVQERLGAAVGIEPDEDVGAVGQPGTEHPHLTGLPLDHHLGLAPVRLHRLRPGERKRQVHLRRLHQPLPLADILPHRALAAGEAVLLTEPLIDPSGCVPLLGLHMAVFFEPPVDDLKVRSQHWVPGLGGAFPLFTRGLEITADRLAMVPRPPTDLADRPVFLEVQVSDILLLDHPEHPFWLPPSPRTSGAWVDRGGPLFLHHRPSDWDTFRVAFTYFSTSSCAEVPSSTIIKLHSRRRLASITHATFAGTVTRPFPSSSACEGAPVSLAAGIPLQC